MTVHVHIDRVVVDGVGLPPGEADRLRAAIRSELADLLTAERLRTPQAVPSGHTYPAELRVNEHVTAKALGVDVARAIFRGVWHA